MIEHIKVGETFTISDGEYSDYGVIALCRAKQEIDIDSLIQEYLSINPEQIPDYYFEYYKFVKWLLVDKNVAEEIPYRELHLGGYGKAEPKIDTQDSVLTKV